MKIQYGFTKIHTGSDLAVRRLPWMKAQSENPGPLLWLTACVHGEEVGGMALVHEVFRRLRKKKLLCGELRAFPLMNPLGFESGNRHVFPTGEDLNRCFPGNSQGSLAQRIAEKIFRAVMESQPTLVVDLHNDWVRSVPYGLLDASSTHIDASILNKAREYLSSTGLIQVADNASIPGSFTHNLLTQGVPAITLELGESFRVNEEIVELGIKVIWRLLYQLGMIDESPAEEKLAYVPEGFSGKLLKYSGSPLSPSSGLIRFRVKPGDTVRKNQPIARIYNSLGKVLKTLKAPEKGIVLGHTDYAMIFPGMPVMAFAYLDNPEEEDNRFSAAFNISFNMSE